MNKNMEWCNSIGYQNSKCECMSLRALYCYKIIPEVYFSCVMRSTNFSNVAALICPSDSNKTVKSSVSSFCNIFKCAQ